MKLDTERILIDILSDNICIFPVVEKYRKDLHWQIVQL